MKNLSLYIHIPFCVRKCHYCDFLSSSCDGDTRQKYVNVLCREIAERAGQFKNKKVDTIFFGGGTPSLLEVYQMEQIMRALRTEFQILDSAEISLEMNPGTVDKEKLRTYRNLGINRLSIGLQSANNDELRILGRIHTWGNFLDTWKMIRQEGFTNVNIDVMSALPGQTMESYEETLKKVLALKPEHISAYSLIVEEGTLFYQWYGEENINVINELPGEIQNKKLPNENTDRQMYELTKQVLEEHGYHRYEISNYSLKGYECKHNIGYWKRKEYLGLGLGAASLLFREDSENYEVQEKQENKISVINLRCTNITDLQEYLNIGQVCESDNTDDKVQSNENTSLSWLNTNKWIEEKSLLSENDQMEEFMFLGLRMMEGVSPEEFEKQFGKSLQEVYGTQIRKLEKLGLLQYQETTKRYALTLQGIDVSNQVFAEFLF